MKRNDGYALPFVLVVMVVVCLIAVSVMSFSLRCLQSQQASIESMVAKYEALGEVEKVIALLESAKTGPVEIEENEILTFTDTANTFIVASGDVGYTVTIAAAIDDTVAGKYTISNLTSISYAPLEQEDGQ